MDGLDGDRRELVIESWMRAVINDGGVDRYDDLHIDAIDERWKHRPLWISGALESHDLALTVRDRNGFDISIGVGFSLEPSNFPGGVNFGTREELECQLNRTPPSLYLFHSGTEPWAKRDPESAASAGYTTVAEIEPAILQIPGKEKHCTYFEFRQGGNCEYFRSVFIWS
jgi:hypothetical protein